MKLRSRAYALAVLASVALPAVAATMAHAADGQDLTWSKDRLSKFDAAIAAEQDAAKRQGVAASQDQAFETDAVIAVLEQDLATRRGDRVAKGQAVLNEIRATRDADRAKFRQLATNAKADVQAADSRRSPQESSNAFWGKVNAYLDAVDADVAARQAATQTKFLGN